MRTARPMFMAFLLSAAATAAWAQQREISGRITAASGEPLAAAAVQAVGSPAVAFTDSTGAFRVSVPAGELRLRVELFGYRTATVSVGAGDSNLDLQLETDVLNLEGIVITGQATTVARRNLANAVSTVTPQMIQSAPSAQTIEKIMQGQVPGAYVEQNSGAPGGGIQVRLRGVSTIIGASEPLYVVDGVIVSNVGVPSNVNAITEAAGGSNPSLMQDVVVNRIADLNPHEIERIEILKGASAAALYGSRAANGVILINTRRGQPGRARFTVSQRFGIYDISKKIGFRQWTRDEAVDAFGDDAAGFFGSDGNPLVNLDHEELLAGHHDLSWETTATVSGGDESTQYFVAGTWRADNGIIESTFSDKQSLRINLGQSLGERFSVDVSANLIHTISDRGLTNNDNSGTSYYMVLPFTPNFIDLRPRADPATGQPIFPANVFERSNPLQTAALMQNEEDVWRMMGGVTGRGRIVDAGRHGLDALAIFGIDWFRQKNDVFSPPLLQFEDDDGLPGTALLSNSDNRDITLTGNLIYTYTGSRFSTTSTAGATFSDRELDIARISSFGLTAAQPSIDAGVVNELRDDESRIKDLGFFAQQELLLLDERLFLSAGLLADRSSVNAETDKFFFYPKAAASYRFDELAGALDALKLRFAWGQSGNQPLFGQKFTPLTATANIDGLPGLTVSGVVASPDLKPERQEEFEFGFDVTLFDGDAQFEATAFQKTITDLLLQRTPAPTTGFNTEFFNGGELRIRGLELALSAAPIRAGDFSWVTRTTYARDYSTVTDLPVPPFETGGFGTSLGAFRIEEGASATQIVVNSGRDSDGDVIVARAGDANPSFRMSFANDFSWKGLTLSSLFDWSHGNSVINLTNFLADAGANSGDYTADRQDFTRADGSVLEAGRGQRRILRRGDFDDSRGYIEGGSYLKLRQLSLSYSLPRPVVQGVLGSAVESLDLRLSGRDLVTWTGYTGLDPEVSNFGNQPVARNIDVAPFPPSRSWWLSASVTF